MRIDRLLWFLRFVKTRGSAQELVASGHIRLNGARVLRSARAVSVGDRLVFPMGEAVRSVEIIAMPSRRGPAGEAATCYRTLDAPDLPS